MISKQLPAALNMQKYYLFYSNLCQEIQSINVPNCFFDYFTEITTFQLINLIKSDLIQISFFVLHN